VTVQTIHMLAADLIQPRRPQVGGMQEDRRTHIRGQALLALLPGVEADQPGQPLGLAVGQDVRVVLGREAGVGHPADPLGAVSGDLTLPVLELQHIQAAGREHQRVDLVDGTVGADELDVRPDVVRIHVGQI
jgi:hypothetical protein